MPVTRDEVMHVAALARLSIADDRASAITAQLNTILEHMEVLSRVNTDRVQPVVGVGAEGAPLAADEGPAVKLQVPVAEFAPSSRDGFFLVPRLSTHEDSGEG